MKQGLTYRLVTTSPMGGYPCASDADYGYGTGMFNTKTLNRLL